MCWERRAALRVLMLQLLLSPLIFSDLTRDAFEFPRSLVLKGSAILLLGLGLSRLVTLRRGATGSSSIASLDLLSWGVLAFVASAAASTLLSISPRVSLLGAPESFAGLPELASYGVIFFATRATVTGLADARMLLWATVVATCGTCAYAIVQLAGVDPVDWVRVAGFAGLVRIFGTLGHPNLLGAYLAATLPICVWAALREARQGRRVAAAILSAGVAAGFVAVIACLSRGAWLALVASIGVLALGALRTRVLPRPRSVLAGAVVGLCLAAPALGVGGRDSVSKLAAAALTRLDSVSALAAEPRVHIWRGAWQIYADHPLTGVGPDAFSLAFTRVRPAAYWHAEWNGLPNRAHNQVLQVAATQGSLGLGALALVAAGLALAGLRAGRATRELNQRGIVLALAAGIAGYAVQSLTGFGVAATGTLVAVWAGLCSRLAVKAAPDHTPRDESALLDPHSFLYCLVLGVGAAFWGFTQSVPGGVPLEVGLAYLLGLLAPTIVAFRAEQVFADPPPEVQRARSSDPRLSLIRAALAVPLLLALAWALGPPLRANLRAKSAAGLMKAGHPEAARLELELAVAAEPSRFLYWIELGEALHASGLRVAEPDDARRHLEGARRAVRQALERVPADAYATANLGLVLAALARLEPTDVRRREVLAAFDRALEIDAESAYFLRDAARAALELGALDRATSYASRSVELYPDYALPRLQLGHVALARSDWASASRELQAATQGRWRGEPGVLDAWKGLAQARLAQGRREAALAAYWRVLARDPADSDARAAVRMLASGPPDS